MEVGVRRRVEVEVGVLCREEEERHVATLEVLLEPPALTRGEVPHHAVQRQRGRRHRPGARLLRGQVAALQLQRGPEVVQVRRQRLTFCRHARDARAVVVGPDRGERVLGQAGLRLGGAISGVPLMRSTLAMPDRAVQLLRLKRSAAKDTRVGRTDSGMQGATMPR